MLTDSEALLEAGLGVASRAWTRFCGELGWTAATPARVICHQVGRVHQRRLLADLGIDEARDYPTYAFMGNTGSAAVPLTLAAAVEAGAIRQGDDVALLGIGSGLSSVMMGVRW
jgi:3-oxoacyl-[acyl-carrier-protein] synthase-3